MAWLEDSVETNTEQKTVDNWLKISDPAAVGKTTEVRLRVLDEEPIGVWRHWLDKRPYNCPGIEHCPVCRVRFEAKKQDPEGYKNTYRMDYRYYFNALVEHEVKIWSFTSSVGRKLIVFQEKYGDLRNYDISIRKRKTGPLPQNVEYDIIFEKEFALNTEDTAISENRFDLTPFIVPADAEALRSVARGEEPAYSGGTDNVEGKPQSNRASKADMIMLKALVENKGYKLADFGLVEDSPPAKSMVVKLIEELKQEKR